MSHSIIPHQRPCREYREALRYPLHTMATQEERDCILMGKSPSDLCMNDLEAAYELMFGADPRVHAPAKYRSIRR